MNAGFLGAIIGSILGLIGGIIGTYFSIKNTNGPRERAFMIKACILGWLAIILFLILMFTIPQPYNQLLWILYGIFLPLGIITGNRTIQRIRNEESNK